MTRIAVCWDDIQYDQNPVTHKWDVPVASGHVSYYVNGKLKGFARNKNLSKSKPRRPSIATRMARYYRARGWAEFPLRTTHSRGYEFHIGVPKETYK